MDRAVCNRSDGGELLHNSVGWERILSFDEDRMSGMFETRLGQWAYTLFAFSSSGDASKSRDTLSNAFGCGSFRTTQLPFIINKLDTVVGL